MSNERKGFTSASYAEADILCPGRFQACQGLPEPARQPDAERGTRIHDYLAGKFVTLTPEELECAAKLSEQARKIDDAWAGPEDKLFYHFEERLWMDAGSFKHSGKPDMVVVNKENRRALVIDYKTGWDDVTESPRNGQLRDLACLVAINYQVLEVTVCIVQPFGKPEPCLYTLDDLATATHLLERRIAACHEPDPPRIPGKDQCEYCLAANTCPEHHAWLTPVLKGRTDFPASGVRQWSPDQRAQFCERKGSARKWLDERESEIKELLAEDPNAVPGYKLGKPAVRETIVDAQTVHRRFVEHAMKFAVNGDAKQLTESFLKTLKVNKGDLKDTLRQLLGVKGQPLDALMHTITEGCVETKICSPPLEEI
jgi:hypothetical protein